MNKTLVVFGVALLLVAACGKKKETVAPPANKNTNPETTLLKEGWTQENVTQDKTACKETLKALPTASGYCECLFNKLSTSMTREQYVNPKTQADLDAQDAADKACQL